jgi:hypothetical protein
MGEYWCYRWEDTGADLRGRRITRIMIRPRRMYRARALRRRTTRKRSRRPRRPLRRPSRTPKRPRPPLRPPALQPLQHHSRRSPHRHLRQIQMNPRYLRSSRTSRLPRSWIKSSTHHQPTTYHVGMGQSLMAIRRRKVLRRGNHGNGWACGRGPLSAIERVWGDVGDLGLSRGTVVSLDRVFLYHIRLRYWLSDSFADV